MLCCYNLLTQDYEIVSIFFKLSFKQYVQCKKSQLIFLFTTN